MSGSVNFALARACAVLTPIISMTVAGSLTELSCSSAPHTVTAKAVKLMAKMIGLMAFLPPLRTDSLSLGEHETQHTECGNKLCLFIAYFETAYLRNLD